MPTVDERPASLEAKVDTITELRVEMNRRFTEMNARFTQIDQRFTRMDERFDRIDAKVDRNFVWSTGTMMTGFIAVIAAADPASQVAG